MPLRTSRAANAMRNPPRQRARPAATLDRPSPRSARADCQEPMSATTPLSEETLHPRLGAALAQVNRVLLGKPRQVQLAFTCLIAGGHLLLEAVPGVGKTTLAPAL